MTAPTTGGRTAVVVRRVAATRTGTAVLTAMAVRTDVAPTEPTLVRAGPGRRPLATPASMDGPIRVPTAGGRSARRTTTAGAAPTRTTGRAATGSTEAVWPAKRPATTRAGAERTPLRAVSRWPYPGVD